MSVIVETISEMADAVRELGGSLVRVVGGVRTPIDSADVSALTEFTAGKRRRHNDDAQNESAGNADAR